MTDRQILKNIFLMFGICFLYFCGFFPIFFHYTLSKLIIKIIIVNVFKLFKAIFQQFLKGSVIREILEKVEKISVSY